MTHPDPIGTLGARGTNRYLVERDPMLAAAMDAHGAEWHIDLQASLELQRDDARGLPGVVLSTLEHVLEWPAGDGRATYKQVWNARDGRWRGEFTMAAVPETMAIALEGRPLSDVISAAGADAWMIEDVRLVPGILTELRVARRHSND